MQRRMEVGGLVEERTLENLVFSALIEQTKNFLIYNHLSFEEFVFDDLFFRRLKAEMPANAKCIIHYQIVPRLKKQSCFVRETVMHTVTLPTANMAIIFG